MCPNGASECVLNRPEESFPVHGLGQAAERPPGSRTKAPSPRRAGRDYEGRLVRDRRRLLENFLSGWAGKGEIQKNEAEGSRLEQLPHAPRVPAEGEIGESRRMQGYAQGDEGLVVIGADQDSISGACPALSWTRESKGHANSAYSS